MADSSTFLDPSVTMSLLAPGLVDQNGNFDPQAYQQARQNYGQLGMAAALLAASGASRLPVTFGAALGQGLQGMMGAEQAYDQQALRGAQAGYYLANTGKLGLENQMLRAKLPLFRRYFDIMTGGAAANPGGAAIATASPAADTSAPAASASPSSDDASADAGPLDTYADRVAMVESGGNPDAKNPNSSATGLGQFTNATWLDVARRAFPETAQMGDDALLAMRTDPDFSKEMIKAYARDNAPVLADAGLPVNGATLYAAHFLGPDGAVKVLGADPGTPLSTLLDPREISANPTLKGKTAGDFARMIALKMNVPGNVAQTMRPVQVAQNGPLTSLPAPTEALDAAPAGAPVSSGAASLAPAATVSVPAINGITPQQAAQLTALGPMLGITAPQWMQDLARMAPGGALSPQYIGQAETAKAQADARYRITSGRPGSLMYNGLGQVVGANPVLTHTVDAQGNQHPAFVTAPIPGTTSGSVSTLPGTTALGPGAEESLKTRGEEEQKQRQIVINEANAAQQQRATLLNMANEAGNFVQGPFSDHAQTAASYLRLIDPAFNGQVASYEDFVKNAGSLTRQAVREVSGRAAVQEFNMIQNTLPNPDMSPQGLQRVQNELIGLSDYKLAKAQAQQQWEMAHGGIGNVSGFETAWQKNASPYAFIVARMNSGDRQAMIAKLQGTAEGRHELAQLQQQLRYLKQTGLAP